MAALASEAGVFVELEELVALRSEVLDLLGLAEAA